MNPVAALLILPIAWIAIAAGRQINRLIAPSLASEAVAVERSIFGLGTGYILLALGVLAVGLAGHLEIGAVVAWGALLALIGAREHSALAREIAGGVARARSVVGKLWWFWLLMGVVASAALGGCFVPPVSSEWDSLSYHLADPAIYVAQRRIGYLPWESHSNFAFNMEMLYSIGMLAHSMALAKLFHYVIGIAGAVAVWRIAVRLGAGESAAFQPLALTIYVTLPLIYWEAGTAYVDLAATTYAALALLALAIALRKNESRFVGLAGVMLGGMLGIKATALVTILLYAVGLLLAAKMRKEPLSHWIKLATGMALLAFVIGSPWYIKSWAYTGNPFYPFGYSIFGGRYWNVANSAAYTAAQNEFGVGHRAADLLLAPWNLVMYLLPGHIPPANAKGFNDYQTILDSLSPIFLFCMIATLAVPLNPPRAIRLMGAYSAAAIVIWFVLTQQVRYLLPVVPVFCILSAWTLARLTARSKTALFAAAVAGVSGLAFNAYIIAGDAASKWAQAVAPETVREAYLTKGLNSYSAAQFLNTQTKPDAKVVCYGEPRTLYIKRPHMWGEPGHSLLIPYAQFGGAESLRAWLVGRGYRYILVNAQFIPLQDSTNWSGMVYKLTVGSGRMPVFADERRGVFVFRL